MRTHGSPGRPDRVNALASSREGFTLVEMLVSVTLVLIMMAMFAQVFEIASGIHVKIRGMSTNDQRARILSTLLRSDLNKLTIRNATPFRHMEDQDRTIIDRDLGNRQGYLYVSENLPESDLDDVIQFTASADLRLGDFTDSTQFAGKSINLRNLGLQVLFDQPDWDDGHENNASESVTAEISYFVRAGALYRRVLLLRQPHPRNSAQPTIDEDKNQNGQLDASEDINGNGVLDRGIEVMTYYSGRSFWNDFDHSAHWDIGIGELDLNNDGQLDPAEDYNNNGRRDLGGATFHGTGTLNNSVSVGCYTEPSPALGKRRYRFGHSLTLNIAREYDDVGAFLGRFTHEETSHRLFQYPTVSLYSPLDFDPPNCPVVRDSADGVVARFRNGPRRSEDLLMTNVHSFDVKILRASHADPGYLELYDEDFDTRHPRDSHLLASEDVNGDGYFNHGNADGVLYDEDTNGNRRLDTEDTNGNGQLDPSEDTNGNGILDPGEDTNGNGLLDPDEDINGNGVLDYEDLNNNGRLDTEDLNGNGRLDTEDTNGNGQLDPGEDINHNLRLDLGEDYEEDINGNNHLDIYLPRRWKRNMSVARSPLWPRLPSEDLNGNGKLDQGEDSNFNGQLDFFYNEDLDGDGQLDPSEDVNGNNRLDHYVVRASSRPGTNGRWFRPVAFGSGNSGRTGFREPEWPSRLGLAHDRRSMTDWRRRAWDGSVRWQAISDRHRAMGIHITVRMLDPKSGQFRQVTILHPLTGK